MAEFKNLTSVNGTTDDDLILGTTGDDTLSGGDGDDIITPGGAVSGDTIDGGGGTDTINFGNITVDGTGYAGALGSVDISLRDGKIYDDGYGNTQGTVNNVENVIGSEQGDTIQGDDLDNVITGGGGIDFLYGEGGDDTFVVNSITGSFIDGGDHTKGKGDTVDYSGVANTTNLTVDLGRGLAQTSESGSVVDTLSGIENIVTGKGDDTIELVGGVRNRIVHTTNADEDGNATGLAGNGGTDTLVNFELGQNLGTGRVLDPNKTFDILDLSSAEISYADRGEHIKFADGASGLEITFTADLGSAGADATTVVLKDLQISDLEAAYGLTAGTFSSGSTKSGAEAIIDAMLDNGNLAIRTNMGDPVLDLPFPQEVDEGQSLVFDGVTQINVKDFLNAVDADGNPLVNVNGELTLTIAAKSAAGDVGGNGVIKLGGQSQGSGAVVTDDNTSVVTITGTVGEINLALADLEYKAFEGNDSADEVLRFDVIDDDGSSTSADLKITVNAAVQNPAALSVNSADILVNALLGLSLQGVADLDVDDSEQVKLEVRGMPDSQAMAGTYDVQLSSQNQNVTITSGTVGTDLVWTVEGAVADVENALGSLEVTGLGGQKLTLELVAVTTDVDTEGFNVEASSKPVVIEVQAYAADVVAETGRQAVADAAKVQRVIGEDGVGTQFVGAAGKNVFQGYATDSGSDSDRDIVFYNSESQATEGVGVNLELKVGKGGAADGNQYDGIEGAVGTDLDDRFVGVSAQRNHFLGGLGDDTFVADMAAARGQDDMLSGGLGSDTLSLERFSENSTDNGNKLTVDLNVSAQDFNVDGIRDARISSIENVIASGRDDTVTLVNSTEILDSNNNVSGSKNINTFLVNRIDAGNNLLKSFDLENDVIDLSGVLKTGNVADLASFVTLGYDTTTGDAILSIQKDKSTATATVVLDGVTEQGLTAAGLETVSKLVGQERLVHSMAAYSAQLNASETDEAGAGGRAVGTIFFDGQTVARGYTAAQGDSIELTVGKTLVSHELTDVSVTIDTAIAGFVTKVNATSGLGATAVVNADNPARVDLIFDVGVSTENAFDATSAVVVDSGGNESKLLVSSFPNLSSTDNTLSRDWLFEEGAGGFVFDTSDWFFVSDFDVSLVASDNSVISGSGVTLASLSSDLKSKGVISAVDTDGDFVIYEKTEKFTFDSGAVFSIQKTTVDWTHYARVETDAGEIYYYDIFVPGSSTNETMKVNTLLAEVVNDQTNLGLSAVRSADNSIHFAVGSGIKSVDVAAKYETLVRVDDDTLDWSGILGTDDSLKKDDVSDSVKSLDSIASLETFNTIIEDGYPVLPSFDVSSPTKGQYNVSMTGSVSEGVVYAVSINGKEFSVTAGATDGLADVRGNLVTAINADQRGWNQEVKLTLDGSLSWSEGAVYSYEGYEYTYGASDSSMYDVAVGVADAINNSAKGLAGDIKAVLGETPGVVLISSADELTGSPGFTASGDTVATPRASDVATVVEFNSSTTALVTAAAGTGDGDIVLTAGAGGAEVQVSAGIVTPAVMVEQGEQYYYAHAGIADTFVWATDKLDGDDTIEDFDRSADSLDLSGVLVGTSSNIADYITVADGTDDQGVPDLNVSVVAVDVNGDGNDEFSITLNHGESKSLILDDLVNDGALLVPDLIG